MYYIILVLTSLFFGMYISWLKVDIKYLKELNEVEKTYSNIYYRALHIVSKSQPKLVNDAIKKAERGE